MVTIVDKALNVQRKHDEALQAELEASATEARAQVKEFLTASFGETWEEDIKLGEHSFEDNFYSSHDSRAVRIRLLSARTGRVLPVSVNCEFRGSFSYAQIYFRGRNPIKAMMVRRKLAIPTIPPVKAARKIARKL